MAENMKFLGPYANIRLGPGEKKKEAGAHSRLRLPLAALAIGAGLYPHTPTNLFVGRGLSGLVMFVVGGVLSYGVNSLQPGIRYPICGGVKGC